MLDLLDLNTARQYYALFREIIPIPEEEVKNWEPMGSNSILIHLTSGYRLIFMVYRNKDWRILPHVEDQRQPKPTGVE